MNDGTSIPASRKDAIGTQIRFHLRSTMIAISKIKQLIEWAMTTAPPNIPETEHGIFNELNANQTAKPIVASCATAAALTNENDLVCFISLKSNAVLTFRVYEVKCSNFVRFIFC